MSGATPGATGPDRLIAGRYRLLDALGEGGMGIVWRARDEVLGREVAVKEVRAPAGLSAEDVRRLYARLEREAWAAARIPHRNVVTVYDVASEDGRPWIVMELVRGLSLAEVLEAEGPMPPRRAARIGAEVLAALRAAHEAGVLHRDVKPGNVLLANDGRVVLTDFGIARVAGSSNLTMTGELIGSPEFLAPERALGREAGPESDLWSLGVLLYAAVEGVTPFRQDTPLSTLRAVVDEELPPARRAGPLAPVIEGLLRKEPAERLPASQAADRLRLVAAGGEPRTEPMAAGPYAPLPAEGDGDDDGPRGGSPQPPPPGGPTVPMDDGPERSRRAGVVLAVGLAVLLLAVGALAYVLVRQNDTGGKGGGTATGGATTGGATTAPPSTPAPSATKTGPTSTPPSSPSVTATPPLTVHVSAEAVRGSYRGPCPAPGGEAPAFTATVSVGRVPATVEYRWTTESGETSAADWETLRFTADGPEQRQVEHTELTYRKDGTRQDRVRVEIRSPAGRSNWVAFSVTCEEASPTGSPYPTGSVTPRS
ncbi:serine/threonine-protein kinase [Streptomyces sp. HUAS MG47]|uniref:serine/threonine-protein kinase n=1 Tax=Streptomyces solicamelliae TaxID=3231716 RepID=UPI003877CFDA